MREVFKELGLIGKPSPTLNKFVEMIMDYRGEVIAGSYLRLHAINSYRIHLYQKPNISMYVAAIEVGGKWEVLEEFNASKHGLINGEYHKQYQQAEENVLFSGFEVEYSMFEDTKRVIVKLENKVQLYRKLTYCSGRVDVYNQEKYKTLNDMVNDGIELIIK